MPPEPHGGVHPSRLCSEDQLQSRHLYQQHVKGTAAAAELEPFTRNTTSGVKFTVDIRGAPEPRAKLAPLNQETQGAGTAAAAAAGAAAGGGSAGKGKGKENGGGHKGGSGSSARPAPAAAAGASGLSQQQQQPGAASQGGTQEGAAAAPAAAAAAPSAKAKGNALTSAWGKAKVGPPVKVQAMCLLRHQLGSVCIPEAGSVTCHSCSVAAHHFCTHYTHPLK